MQIEELINIPESVFERVIARKTLLDFVLFTKPEYTPKWFHVYLCEKLDAFARGEIKNLIVSMPPQHGKSELVSRRLPAYLLGLNPNLKIVGTSYSAPRARKFNRDVQRIIDTPEYFSLFPESQLNYSSVRDASKSGYLRNTDMFEVVGKEGFYYSVGVGGGLTGETVDIGIIDDPIKDKKEASSKLIRNRIWEWYEEVFCTRLHNESQQLITMTRWHEEDIVGRLIKQVEDDPEIEPWEVINFPAIKEKPNKDDPRDIGAPLWPEKHALKKLIKVKKRSPRTWNALYQGNPAPDEGDVFKKSWFGRFDMLELIDETIKSKADIVPQFFLDSSYEEQKGENDPSAIMAAIKVGNYMYVLDLAVKFYGFPDLVEFIPEFMERNNAGVGSRLYIEPKASGKSIAQYLRRHTNISVVDKLPFLNLQDSKEVRAKSITPVCESGRVLLLDGAPWIPEFLDELGVFPNGANDDRVDVLVMAVSKFLLGVSGKLSWSSGNRWKD